MRVSTSTRRGGVSAKRRRALTVTALCMTVTAIAFESISVATAMPAAARALDGLHLYALPSWVLLIGHLFARVPSGRLCDLFGPARRMAGGLELFTVGLVVA